MWTTDLVFLPQQGELDPRRDYAARPFFLGKHAGYTWRGNVPENPFLSWTPEWCDWEGGFVAGRLLASLDSHDKSLSSQR